MSSNAQVLDVYYEYRGERFFLEVIQRAPIVYAATCPVCRTKLRFDLQNQHLIVNLGTRALSVLPNLHCPNATCGWYVAIIKGVATDIDRPPAAEPPHAANGPRICKTCKGYFDPGAAAREECDDCKPPAPLSVRMKNRNGRGKK